MRGGVPDAASGARASPPPGSASQPLCSLVQFDCTNTLNDQTLENVTVQMEPTEAYEVLGYVPARSLPSRPRLRQRPVPACPRVRTKGTGVGRQERPLAA